ncbi:MAG: nodulation protein NfeD [Pseudomonadota bacterium]
MKSLVLRISPVFLWVALSSLAPAPALASQVIKLTIDGTIHSGTTGLIERALESVKEKKAEALLIELDTPGGMLDATRDIVKLFLNTDIPVIVFVSPRGAHAGSAGTFITMAAHVAAMAPGTNIGAAHPISATGSDPEKEGGKHLAQKVENDTVAFMDSIARQRHRNGEWAKKAVVESAAITEDEALKLNVIDFIAKTDKEVLEKADGRTIVLATKSHKLDTKTAQIVEFNADTMTKFKNWLANPTIMFLLIMVAGMGLYIEMSHPGLILPAVLAGVAIILVMFANSVLPITTIGVGLVILGFVLLFIELYVTSFGILAVGGILAFIVGALLLFDRSQTDVRVPKGIIVSTALGFGAVATIIAIAVGKMFRIRQTAGSEGMIGSQAVVDATIRPDKGGRILINGEYWNAFADQEIPTGEKVIVVGFNGLKAHVRKV